MKYTVRPIIVAGCDCEDCRAGRHLYELLRETERGWQWAATSLQTYASAEECRQRHDWGIQFGPNPVWENGSPVVPPEGLAPAAEGMVKLNAAALQLSAKSLKRHCRTHDSTARQFIQSQPDLPDPEAIRRFIMTNPSPAGEKKDDEHTGGLGLRAG